MAGLSVVLESSKKSPPPRVISKAMIKSPAGDGHPILGFLDHCFRCNRKLLPGKDIYMYKGDKAFCSVECRCRQISMDDEEKGCTAAVKGCTMEDASGRSLVAVKRSQQV